MKTWLLKKLAWGREGELFREALVSQEQAIERYRATDTKRAQLHRKLKRRLQSVKQEAALASREARELKKQLAQVEQELGTLQEVLVQHEAYLPRRAEASGERFAGMLEVQKQSKAERRAWRHWMRLGVLEQHPPRPLAVPPPPRRILAADPPKISIVTPSYQQAPFLARTLESVLDQAYPNLEYIVMDGGSQDGSVEVIQAQAEKLSYWQSQKDGGHSAALVAGFARCTGEIMAWLNSDDIYLPQTLAYVAHYFQTHPEVDAVYGHRVLINEVGHELGRWYLPPHDGTMMLWADYIPQETWFWRRRIYDKCGGIDPTIRFAMDWDLLLRMQSAGCVFHRLPEFLGGFRVHAAQKSQAIIHDVGAEDNAMLRQRELGKHFNHTDLQRRCTAYQLRALRTMRWWNLGLRSVNW